MRSPFALRSTGGAPRGAAAARRPALLPPASRPSPSRTSSTGAGMSSTVPPAFSIAARAPAVTRCAFTVTALFSSPPPRTTTPSRLPRTSPAAFSAAGSTTPERPSRSPTWTSSSSRRKTLLKPNFGRRRWSGIWPPSNPSKCMLPERAFWPLPPRPAVLPRPEPWPRPTRVFLRFAPLGALSLESVMKQSPFITRRAAV